MRRRRHVVTLGQFRARFSELLLSVDRPVMVTKDGMPLGFFLPAKVWKSQQDSPLSRQLVELILAHSGQTKESVLACIDDAGLRKQHSQGMNAGLR